MESQRGFAEVNGTRLFYEVAGEGDSLVFIHGHTLDTRMWDDQFSHFAERYRTLRYDMRGYGRSASPPEQPYSHVDDLKALLAFLGMEPALVVGLSSGGMVAVDFALTYPEAVRALVPVDAVISGWEMSMERNTSAAAIRVAALEAGIAAAKALWLADPLFVPACEQPAVAARLAEMVAAYDGWRWLNADPRRVAVPPAVHQLGQIAVPTLVVVGERDLDDFLGIADLLAREIVDARKVIVRGAGHMANMEAPDQFNSALDTFFSALTMTTDE